jgi:hypothetical protein
VALALTILTAADLGLPTENFWTSKKVWLYTCLVLAFLMSAASQSLSALGVQSQAKEIRAFETGLEAATSTTLLRLREVLGVGVEHIGVHVFLISGFHLRGKWTFGHLVLVGRLRVGANPSMHRPRWSPGKGIVGRACLRNKYVAEDWQGAYGGLDQEGWEALSEEKRYGMSWSECQASSGYQLIAARPLHSLVSPSNPVIGCVAIDALCPPPPEHHELQSVLADLASSIGSLDLPPKAWLNQRRLGY